MTNKKDNTNDVALSKIKQSLASGFYYIISPLPCQVKEHETTNSYITIKQGKGGIIFCIPSNHQNNNKIAARWARRIEKTGGMPKPIKPPSIAPSKPPTNWQLTNLLPSQTTAASACTSTMTKNSDKAFLIDQSPPPLLTVAKHPASVHPLTHSYQQANSWTKSFIYPTGLRKQQARSANLQPMCKHLHAAFTSPRASPNCLNQHSKICGGRIHDNIHLQPG
jgi:hypothetical protein